MDAGQNPHRFVSAGMERSSAIRLLVIVMVFPCLILTRAEDATLALMHTRVVLGTICRAVFHAAVNPQKNLRIEQML